MSEKMKAALKTIASRLPDVEEGVACKGTAVESATYKTGGKAFLFLGASHARFKLRESAGEVARLAAKEPEKYAVGAQGWAKLTLGDGAPPLARLEKWVRESYRLLAPEMPKKKKKSR